MYCQIAPRVETSTSLYSNLDVNPTRKLIPRDILERCANALMLLGFAFLLPLWRPINIFYTVNVIHILGDGNSAHQVG